MLCLVKIKTQFIVDIKEEVIEHFASTNSVTYTEAQRILFKIAVMNKTAEEYDKQFKIALTSTHKV